MPGTIDISAVDKQVAAGSRPSAVGRIGTGASIGSTIGSVVPGVGTGIGAAVGAGIGAIASIFGSKKQSSAQKQATQAQTRANDEALAYQKEQDAYARQRAEDETRYSREQDALNRALLLENRDYARGQYANYLGRLNPYLEGGTRAFSGLQGSLRGNIAATTPTMGGGGMVTLRGPDGSTRAVPAGQVDHYVRLGAQRV